MENIKKNLIQHMETFCLKCGTLHSGADGEHMAADKKSVAYSLTLRAFDHTLTDDEVESKINQLSNMLKYTRIVGDDEIESDTVCLGNTVEIQEVGEDEVEIYNIVSPDEIEVYALLNKDMEDVLLSISSPVGKALLGHKKGETVACETPVCTIDFVIKDIYKYEK